MESVTLTLYFLSFFRRRGMTYQAALQLVQRRRPQAQPIPAFVKMLQDYETTCRDNGWIPTESDEIAVTKNNKPILSHEKTAQPQPAPRTASIGPCLPPSKRSTPTITAAKDDDDDDDGKDKPEPRNMKRPRIIGPARPPPSASS